MEFDQMPVHDDFKVDFANLNTIVTEKLQELFDDLDKNHDGSVTVTEWVRRKTHGISEYARILSRFDRDGKSLNSALYNLRHDLEWG